MTVQDAQSLKIIYTLAFASDYDQYNFYPPTMKSLDTHISEIKNGHYYKITYNGEIAGDSCVTPTFKVEVEYFFISEQLQKKPIGTMTMNLMKEYADIGVRKLVTPYKAIRNHQFDYLKVEDFQPNPIKNFVVLE